MTAGSAVILTAFVYLIALFAIAHYGDTSGRRRLVGRARPTIYALSLAVYCTSWTFFGSVGLASASGLDFLTIYLGPLIVWTLGVPLILRVIRLAKSQNITSVADFVAARYGKSPLVAALVALIAVMGSVPYVALQLKAIVASLAVMLGSFEAAPALAALPGAHGVTFSIAVILAFFAMAFGTRRLDATEHQDGLMLAIAAESVVKLVAFLIVGVWVTWSLHNGLADLAAQAAAHPRARPIVAAMPDPLTWATMTLLSACAIVLLPRQFHVGVVENRDERDVRVAAWLFPLYLVAINLFVVPIAVAGLVAFDAGAIDRDMTVLALPLRAGDGLIALIGFIGGISAATAMVIVASVALSIMASNDLIMPLLLRGRLARRRAEAGDLGSIILFVRRGAILALLGLAWFYLRIAGEAGLAQIGLLSFAAVAQIAPAFLGGLLWKRANARGAAAGLVAGTLIWAYTLLLPSLDASDEFIRQIVIDGPLGFAALKPTALFGLDLPRLPHGVMWSLSGNIAVFIVASLTRRANPIERLQAGVFVGGASELGQTIRLWRAATTLGELEATVARYLGGERTQRAFEDFMRERGLVFAREREADVHLVRFTEHLLASVIGAASSRLVLSLLLRRRTVSTKAAIRLLDEASAAIQYNRDTLQNALDHARQGISVFDRDLRLLCWNREFRDLFDFPAGMLHVGAGLEELIRFNAGRGVYGGGRADDHVAARLEELVNDTEPARLRISLRGQVIESRSARMPDGGLVTTYADVTETVAFEEKLAATNESLERRVAERTEELTRLNEALARAKSEAEEANLSKTRFLAAASHDLLQPLNAARLYASSLLESGANAPGQGELARNVDLSLEAVEEILTALLDISRLDAGAMKPEFGAIAVDDLFGQLRLEFDPVARAAGLRLDFVDSGARVVSDRRLLRRLLQNLVSNAVKYTLKGRVLVGCRRRGEALRIEVWDTGIGVAADKRREIFAEFRRLDEGARTARGLGLGLSIVERIARTLGHDLELRSTPGKGSVFSIEARLAPAAAAAPAPAEAQPPTPAGPLAGLRALCIDNEPRILDGMRAMLERWGCEALPAADLAAARAAIAASAPPDLVIADFHLDGGATGLGAIAALRAELGEDLPAILLTADRSAEVRRAAGAADVRLLTKPVRPAALRALLATARGARAAAE